MTFYTEMRDLILPAMRKLEDALQFAAEGTGKIHHILREAEEDAAQLFRGRGRPIKQIKSLLGILPHLLLRSCLKSLLADKILPSLPFVPHDRFAARRGGKGFRGGVQTPMGCLRGYPSKGIYPLLSWSGGQGR